MKSPASPCVTCFLNIADWGLLMKWLVALGCIVFGVTASARAELDKDSRFPLFAYLTSQPSPTLMLYTPSQLDPRQEVNQRKLPTSSIRADLEVLRPAFDGLILYGYNESCTPRILAVAKELKFHAIILAVYDPKSSAEIDGVAELTKLFKDDFIFGVLIGNEGLTFKRYEIDDLKIAADRMEAKIADTIPIGTSEPLVGYDKPFPREFGQFLAPNIHPVFDRPQFGPAEAAAWAREQAARLAKQTKKPVLLKETGFPHDGKAGFTPDAQKQFWAAYVKPGLLDRQADAPNAWVYYGTAFEGFDLPWKAEESHLPFEKSWGLLSADRKPFPAFDVWRALADKNRKNTDK
jgi:exo-beta-1,3-glucanase (GH17 family)